MAPEKNFPCLRQDTIIASTTSTIDLKTLKTGFPASFEFAYYPTVESGPSSFPLVEIATWGRD